MPGRGPDRSRRRPRGSPDPSPSELEVLVAIEAHHRVAGCSPTHRDVDDFLGRNCNTQLQWLKRAGLVTRGQLRITGPACRYVYPIPGRREVRHAA